MKNNYLKESISPLGCIAPMPERNTMVIEYQRRTTTGIGLKKTVRGSTGKTPRNIAAVRGAASA
jgi:hypothetical protein